jgi:hypothetical protein
MLTTVRGVSLLQLCQALLLMFCKLFSHLQLHHVAANTHELMMQGDVGDHC